MTKQKTDPTDTPSYTRMTADVYDALYSKKSYKAEAAKLKQIIADRKESTGNELLEVACGTGLFLPHLVDEYQVTGVDLSGQQLVAARRRLPDVTFTQGDMRDFNLHHKFDVVTCLFSSIGYVHPLEEMKQAIQNMTAHLKPGGVLVVEPWLQPGVFDPTRPPHQEVGELPERQLKVTRTAHNSLDGNVSVMAMHHLVESPEGREEFTEEHRLALYTNEQYQHAFEEAGLSFELLQPGLTDRGLYVGILPGAV